MPNEVIQGIHRLAAVCRKHRGIVFKDRNGNIIEDNRSDDDKESNSTEITGVSTGVGNTKTINTETNDNMLEEINNNNNSTGVGNTETETSNTLENINIPDNTEMNTQGKSTPGNTRGNDAVSKELR